jgi:hypothetical protein
MRSADVTDVVLVFAVDPQQVVVCVMSADAVKAVAARISPLFAFVTKAALQVDCLQ